MSATILWLDHEHAKTYNLLGDKIEIDSFKRTEIKHHTSSQVENHKDYSKYFNEVMKHLTNSNEILLVGPGTAKTQFKHHLEKHHQDMLKKIVGTETVDHPTDNEIVALARKFFKKFDLYNHPIN